MRYWGFCLLSLCLGACATVSSTTSIEAQKPDGPIVIEMAVPALVTASDQASAPMGDLPYGDPYEVRHEAGPALKIFQRIEKANKAATIEPDLQNYRNAIQVYPFSAGALYQLYAAPGQVSLITLQQGEELVSVSAGDTARWMVGDTQSGVGLKSRVNILIKPVSSGLITNLVITTSKRTYLMELKSYRQTYMAGVSWHYPLEEARLEEAWRKGANAGVYRKTLLSAALNFRYEISGHRPDWRPIRVFDDGRKIYVEFPHNFKTAETPPLFVIGENNTPELVNYRVRGRFYIVDRLFDRAELRLGTKAQRIVRITRVNHEARDDE